MAAFHPDRTFAVGTRLKDLIADLLTRPVPGGFPPLLPHPGGRLEILCGPGKLGENRLWVEEVPPDGPHSQDIQDLFTRADSALSGSTSSDGQFTWTLVGGNTTYANVVSNQAKFNNNLVAGYFHVFRPSLGMDTINHYAQHDFVSYSGTAGLIYVSSEVAVRMRVGDGAGGDEGYSFEIDHDGAAIHNRSVYDFMGSALPGASDTTDSASGTMKLEFSGSTYVATLNGATIFSGTDTAYSTYKNTCEVSYISGSGTPVVIADNFRAADVPHANTAWHSRALQQIAFQHRMGSR